MRFFLLATALAAATLAAPAQTLPRLLQPRADHGVGNAYKVRHDASLSTTPKTVRKQYKMTHHESRKYRNRHRKQG